jgi:hypothetical protein
MATGSATYPASCSGSTTSWSSEPTRFGCRRSAPRNHHPGHTGSPISAKSEDGLFDAGIFLDPRTSMTGLEGSGQPDWWDDVKERKADRLGHSVGVEPLLRSPCFCRTRPGGFGPQWRVSVGASLRAQREQDATVAFSGLAAAFKASKVAPVQTLAEPQWCGRVVLISASPGPRRQSACQVLLRENLIDRQPSTVEGIGHRRHIHSPDPIPL